ncbi:hypothetical protein HK096_000758, partial [Nowakowskiella sp. JEL0078]
MERNLQKKKIFFFNACQALQARQDFASQDKTSICTTKLLAYLVLLVLCAALMKSELIKIGIQGIYFGTENDMGYAKYVVGPTPNMLATVYT